MRHSFIVSDLIDALDDQRSSLRWGVESIMALDECHHHTKALGLMYAMHARPIIDEIINYPQDFFTEQEIESVHENITLINAVLMEDN